MFRLIGRLFDYLIDRFARPTTFEDLTAAWTRYGERYAQTPEHKRNVQALQEQLRRNRKGQGFDA